MAKLPNLRALQAFEAVGRLGSVTEGATELNVSAGAVSQMIHKVEDMLGVTLLERQGKRLQLTTLGRLYHNELAVGFERLRNAQEILQYARMTESLVVSCLPSVASKWIGRQLHHWQASHPGAPIHLIGSELEECAEKQIDFRITYGENVRAFQHYVELFTDWAVPACSPALLREHPVNSPRDILAAPLLGIKWGPKQSFLPSWDHWAAQMNLADADTTPSLTYSLSALAIDAAVDGHGFVLGQLSMIAEDIAAGRLVVPIDARIKMLAPYYLAWDRAALEKPLGPVFRTWVIGIAKRQAIASAPQH